eukprot:8870-Heterococcus_DN1.PRE.5
MQQQLCAPRASMTCSSAAGTTTSPTARLASTAAQKAARQCSSCAAREPDQQYTGSKCQQLAQCFTVVAGAAMSERLHASAAGAVGTVVCACSAAVR